MRQYPIFASSFNADSNSHWSDTDTQTGAITKMVGGKSGLYTLKISKDDYPNKTTREVGKIIREKYKKHCFTYNYNNKIIHLPVTVKSVTQQNKKEYAIKFKVIPDDVKINVEKDFYQTREKESMNQKEYLARFQSKVMVAGVFAKFSQDPNLRKLLLATKDLQITHSAGRGSPAVHMLEFEIVRDCLQKFPHYHNKYFISTLLDIPI